MPPIRKNGKMTINQRIANYYDQNGCERLTPRQRRRVAHKARKHTKHSHLRKRVKVEVTTAGVDEP
jgi:hypothetical protein